MRKYLAICAGLLALVCNSCYDRDQMVRLKADIEEFNSLNETIGTSETVVTEYLKYYMEKRKELALLEAAQPWKWEKFVSEWQFVPAGAEVKGVVVYGYLLAEKRKDIHVVFPMSAFPEIADISFQPDWLDFLKKADSKFEYEEVASAAEAARYQFQIDIFESPVPSAIGEPMVPILLKALYKRHLSRYAIQHLQVISGKSFGYYAEMPWADQKKVFERWQEWWQTQNKEAGFNGRKGPFYPGD